MHPLPRPQLDNHGRASPALHVLRVHRICLDVGGRRQSGQPPRPHHKWLASFIFSNEATCCGKTCQSRRFLHLVRSQWWEALKVPYLWVFALQNSEANAPWRVEWGLASTASPKSCGRLSGQISHRPGYGINVDMESYTVFEKRLWEDGGCPSETQKNLPSKKSKKFIQIPWPNNPFHTHPPWPPTAAHLQILAFLPWQHWASVSPPNADVKNLHLHPLLQRASGSSLPGSACSMPSETSSRSVGKGVRCASTHVFYEAPNPPPTSHKNEKTFLGIWGEALLWNHFWPLCLFLPLFNWWGKSC